jgi:heptosyltransferase III
MNRILVVCTRQIGDVLLTTPLVRAARRRWPQAQVDVLGFSGTLGMLRGNADIHELIEMPARPGLSGLYAFARRLWRRYDLALVTLPSDRAHLIAWIAARQRSGVLPEHGGSNWWKRLLLDHAVVSTGDEGSRHAVQEKLELLAPWVERPETPAVSAPAGAPLPADLQAALRERPVVVHVPSMWPYKQWAPEKYAQVVRTLLDRGHQVVLTGGPGARDRECIAPLRSIAAAPALLDASGRLDFNQLVTLLQRASLYIGPDTSVSHLAAAAGTPTLAIFGPTNPQRWAPWPGRPGEQPVHFQRRALEQSVGNVTLLQAELPCVPCSKAGCEDHRQSRSDCLIAITPERVTEAALRMLGEKGSPASPARG